MCHRNFIISSVWTFVLNPLEIPTMAAGPWDMVMQWLTTVWLTSRGSGEWVWTTFCRFLSKAKERECFRPCRGTIRGVVLRIPTWLWFSSLLTARRIGRWHWDKSIFGLKKNFLTSKQLSQVYNNNYQVIGDSLIAVRFCTMKLEM